MLQEWDALALSLLVAQALLPVRFLQSSRGLTIYILEDQTAHQTAEARVPVLLEQGRRLNILCRDDVNSSGRSLSLGQHSRR
jgi:hypothetical protein